MKKTKIIGAFLLALMLAAMFTGCAANTDIVPTPEPLVQTDSISTTEAPDIPVEDVVENATEDSDANAIYRTEELRVLNDDKSIFGVLYIPEAAETALPAVILSHGYGGTHVQGDSIAQAFTAQGYIVYVFDFCGGSARSQSDGATTEMSVMTEVSDLHAVIDALQGNSMVDANNIFLFGTSQGGCVSAIAAALRPEDVRGLVLQFPAFVIRDDMHNAYASLDDIAETVQFMGMEIGRIYYEDMWDYDVYEHIGNYTGDVLIFHGDNDPLVPLSYSEQAVAVYESAHLEVFEGQGHSFGQPYSGIMLEMTLDYLAAHVQ